METKIRRLKAKTGLRFWPLVLYFQNENKNKINSPFCHTLRVILVYNWPNLPYKNLFLNCKIRLCCGRSATPGMHEHLAGKIPSDEKKENYLRKGSKGKNQRLRAAIVKSVACNSIAGPFLPWNTLPCFITMKHTPLCFIIRLVQREFESHYEARISVIK